MKFDYVHAVLEVQFVASLNITKAMLACHVHIHVVSCICVIYTFAKLEAVGLTMLRIPVRSRYKKPVQC